MAASQASESFAVALFDGLHLPLAVAALVTVHRAEHHTGEAAAVLGEVEACELLAGVGVECAHVGVADVTEVLVVP